MAFQMGVLLRNAKLNAINTNLGATATLTVFSGAEPANCAAADPSGALVTMSLPSTPFGTASSGAISMTGTWAGTATAAATAASWRIYDSSANCAMQGNVTDMTLTTNTIQVGMSIGVTTFALTEGNA